MRKLLMTGISTAFAAALFAAPASAQFQFGYDDDDDNYGGGVTIEIPIYEEDDYDEDDDEDDYSGGGGDHADWCDERYQTYDRSTNLYYYAPGKQRECDSPHD
jgi:hypothetical protein